MPTYLLCEDPQRVAARDFGAEAARRLEGIDQIAVFSLPLTTRFRRVTVREGLLIRGSGGWGECAPFWDYDPAESATWLRSALQIAGGADLDEAGGFDAAAEFGESGGSDRAGDAGPVGGLAAGYARPHVPVNVTIPVESPAAAAQRVASSGCATAKVKVADPGVSLAEDAVRVEAVARALADRHGAAARVRIDANAAWNLAEATRAIEVLGRAAQPVGGLEYAEQPCRTVEEMCALREALAGEIPLAADELIRRAEDPLRVIEAGGADLAIVKVAPLGGPLAIRRLAEKISVPLVVSSAVDSSIGLAAGVEAAGRLPNLPFACGLDTRRLLAEDVVAEPMLTVDGKMSVDQAREMRRADLVFAGECPADLAHKWWARLGAMLEHLAAEPASSGLADESAAEPKGGKPNYGGATQDAAPAKGTAPGNQADRPGAGVEES